MRKTKRRNRKEKGWRRTFRGRCGRLVQREGELLLIEYDMAASKLLFGERVVAHVAMVRTLSQENTSLSPVLKLMRVPTPQIGIARSTKNLKKRIVKDLCWHIIHQIDSCLKSLHRKSFRKGTSGKQC